MVQKKKRLLSELVNNLILLTNTRNISWDLVDTDKPWIYGATLSPGGQFFCLDTKECELYIKPDITKNNWSSEFKTDLEPLCQAVQKNIDWDLGILAAANTALSEYIKEIVV
jgi:hypothetical protein